MEGYGPVSSGRPAALMPDGFQPMEIVPSLSSSQNAMGDHQHQVTAMGDHQPQIPGPHVTLQQIQVQIAGLPVPDAMALVPAQVHAAAAESPEKAALRSEVAYLQNLIQQQQTYAETVWNEQREHLTKEAEAALLSQREGFITTSSRYETEARDVAAVESAQA